MPKLRKVSGKEAVAALEKLGFRFARQKGSHAILKKETSTGIIGCVVPLHSEIAIGTLKNILRQANVSEEQFEGVL
jgi:predicted RNA binding protein YcfA (HicA-like mRNA interferase family)